MRYLIIIPVILTLSQIPLSVQAQGVFRPLANVDTLFIGVSIGGAKDYAENQGASESNLTNYAKLEIRRNLPKVVIVNDPYTRYGLHFDILIIEAKDLAGRSIGYQLAECTNFNVYGGLYTRPDEELPKFGRFISWSAGIGLYSGSSGNLRTRLREMIQQNSEEFAAQWYEDNPSSQKRRLLHRYRDIYSHNLLRYIRRRSGYKSRIPLFCFSHLNRFEPYHL